MISIEMNKAKEIWRNRIRQARVPLFVALDVAFIHALEHGDTAEQQLITAKKQFLRDLPNAPEIANATTVDELKSFWPDELN